MFCTKGVKLTLHSADPISQGFDFGLRLLQVGKLLKCIAARSAAFNVASEFLNTPLAHKIAKGGEFARVGVNSANGLVLDDLGIPLVRFVDVRWRLLLFEFQDHKSSPYSWGSIRKCNPSGIAAFF